MAIKFNIENTHAVAFPSKLDLGHIVNLVLQQDLDNGTIRGLGDDVEFDQFKDKPVTTFEGKIIGKGTGTDDSYYIRMTKWDPQDPPVFVCEVDIYKNNYDQRFTDPHNWYNPKGKVVRGYVMSSVADVFELSKEGFTNPNAIDIGKTVTGTLTDKLTVKLGS